ncbi:MAG: hypothetical protein R2742_14675 [Micropruina glycogenica]
MDRSFAATGSSPHRRAVLQDVMLRFPATVELAVAALLFAVVIGVPLGYLAANQVKAAFSTRSPRVRPPSDGVVIPVFVLAYLLKVVFARSGCPA